MIIGLPKNLVNSHLNSYSVEKEILNSNFSVLQELGKLWMVSDC